MARLEELLKIQYENNASDLHLSPGNPPMFRVYGDIKPLNRPVLTHVETTALILEIL